MGHGLPNGLPESLPLVRPLGYLTTPFGQSPPIDTDDLLVSGVGEPDRGANHRDPGAGVGGRRDRDRSDDVVSERLDDDERAAVHPHVARAGGDPHQGPRAGESAQRPGSCEG